MMEFKVSNKEVLPYNREQYLDFLDDDSISLIEWYAVSFQFDNDGKEYGLSRSVDVFESLFKNLISTLDDGSFWIINHDDKDMNWFPNDKDNLTSLRTLFEQNNVQNTFRGSLIFMKNDLFKFAKDLISYPYVLSYKNLDISHSKLQFVVKITSHLTIDLLSTDKMLLRKIVKENSLSHFVVKEYRGSSLWSE
jgi:hypothetical protein